MDIKKLRKQHGWSKSEMARRLGVNYRTILRWEKGETKPSQMAQRLLEELAGQSVES